MATLLIVTLAAMRQPMRRTPHPVAA